MVNALFSSKDSGNKLFELEDEHFGWQSICSMYERECNRVRTGLTRMIPKLKEIHIIRDAWTKLNVAPAKIMQVMYEIICKGIFYFCFIYSKNVYCLSYIDMLKRIPMQ